MMLRTKLCSCFLSFLFHTLLLFFSSVTSSTQDYLPRGSSLSVEDESDLLISPDRAFTCGFHGLGENAYWFSIWFTDSKYKTVVWVANRDRPVNGKGSRVSFLRNGVMVLNDVDGSLIWETNTTSTDARKAELLDTGNLVLKDPNGKILWQSFDFPTDTLLPYQHFTKNTKLISSLRIGSFLSGYFSFFFDNDNVLRMIYDGPDISSLYWPNPSSINVYQNGRFNYNSSRVAFFDEMGTFVSSDRLQFSASDVGPGIKRRLTLDYDGNLRLYSLNNLTGLWAITWQALSQACNVHGVCGRNAICVYTPDPKCSCPPGYEVAEPGDWNKGCNAMFNQTCSQAQEKFVQLPQVDYYGFDLNYTTSISMDGCSKLCLDDCRCVAFSYRLSGEGLCFTKSSLFNGFKSPNFPGSIYLRMPVSVETAEKSTVFAGMNFTCPLPKVKVMGSPDMYNIGKSVNWRYLYAFAAALGAIEIPFVVAGLFLLFGGRGIRIPASGEDGYRVMSSQFRKFGYGELKKATKNFKEELGRGGSGAVYRGSLADERVVAVKRLGDSYQGEGVFWAEVSTIGKINHMNLVRMWGFCSEGRHRLLIYEYVEHLSLDKHLFPPNFLGWKERFKVALGTAKGLAYLHHECLEWIIHCDVKPENILLDGDFEAKIADFGLAKLSLRDNMKSEFSQIRGTKGYMAPEWALNLPITAKADVYSYGVVILEMVKGIRLSNWVFDDLGEQETELTRFVRVVGRKIQLGEDSWMEDGVDPRLNGQFSILQAKKMVELGIMCVQEDRSKRPTMAYVVQALLECEDELSRLSSPQ